MNNSLCTHDLLSKYTVSACGFRTLYRFLRRLERSASSTYFLANRSSKGSSRLPPKCSKLVFKSLAIVETNNVFKFLKLQTGASRVEINFERFPTLVRRGSLEGNHSNYGAKYHRLVSLTFVDARCAFFLPDAPAVLLVRIS